MSVDDASLEEGSNLIEILSLPSNFEYDKTTANNHKVKESSSDQNIKTEKDVRLFLSQELDGKGFREGFVHIWSQWTKRPYIRVNGSGWIFKFALWILRYKINQSIYLYPLIHLCLL